MATIKKRGNSYLIKVSCGYDSSGKQVIQSKTWKPDRTMTAKQVEKELNRQVVLFEESCKNGYRNSSVKLSDFIERWFEEYASIKLREVTITNYRKLLPRINAKLGYKRLDTISTCDIQSFITYLSKEKSSTHKGRRSDTLSPKTIKNIIAIVSSVMTYAVKMQLIQTNPCKNATLPTVVKKEKDFYTLEEAQQMLDLFEKEDQSNLKYVVFYTIALLTGLRRGEILGIEWSDIDFDNKILYISRDSVYIDKKGMETNSCKNTGSQRILKISDQLADLLIKYKAWQDNYKASIGSKWVETGRLFTSLTGDPMYPSMPRDYFVSFCQRTGMRFVNNHSFRHLNASLLILKGFDVKTVQACLGHKQASTTLDIYAQSFEQQKALAMQSVSDSFGLKIG